MAQDGALKEGDRSLYFHVARFALRILLANVVCLPNGILWVLFWGCILAARTEVGKHNVVQHVTGKKLYYGANTDVGQVTSCHPCPIETHSYVSSVAKLELGVHFLDGQGTVGQNLFFSLSCSRHELILQVALIRFVVETPVGDPHRGKDVVERSLTVPCAL